MTIIVLLCLLFAVIGVTAYALAEAAARSDRFMEEWEDKE